MEIQETCLDLASLVRDPGPHPRSRVSEMAAGLIGSEILRIASEIRALVAAGLPVISGCSSKINAIRASAAARASSLSLNCSCG